MELRKNWRKLTTALSRSNCSIFWSITTRLSIAPLWFGTTFLRW